MLDTAQCVAGGRVVSRRRKWELGVRTDVRIAAVDEWLHDADVCKRAGARLWSMAAHMVAESGEVHG